MTKEDGNGKLVTNLDTSVFIHDPGAIKEVANENPGGTIVLSRVVIDELDGLKGHPSKGFKSREASRVISAYLEKGKLNGQSLKTGVSIENGGLLIIDSQRVDNRDDISLDKSNDSQIILTAARWKDKGNKVRIITNDTNFKILVSSCGMDAEMYQGAQRIYNELYSGLTEIELPKEAAGLFTKWHADGGMEMNAVPVDVGNLLANQCCVFRSGTKTLLAIYNKSKNNFQVVKKTKAESKDGKILPKNIEQMFAYDLSFDPDINLVSLAGKAGTGKTLMALLAGYQQMKMGRYDQIIIYRAQVELGEKLGFLPGEIEDKIAPWKYPIMDAMSVILGRDGEGKKKLKELVDGQLIVIEPINYIQGRTLYGKYVVVDECQNFGPKDVKAIVTRLGPESKMVLTGDIAQVGNPYLNSYTNGLTVAIQRLKDDKMFGYITLKEGERSPLVEMVTRRWN